MKAPAKILKAYEKAKSVRLNAHAPYSGFKVGAALVGNGQIVTGCNVENASYGGTVCAERIAIFKAVSEGQVSFSDIVVVTDAPEPAFPCAFCLQVMAEFFASSVNVWLADLNEIRSVHSYGELLPHRFGPQQLADAKAPRAHAGAKEAAALKKAAKAKVKKDAAATKSAAVSAQGSMRRSLRAREKKSEL